MRAGELRARVEFQAREALAVPGDEHGTAVGEWRHQFATRAKMVPLRRGEAVIAGRLQGVQPYILTIRAGAAPATLSTDWRVIDKSTGQAFNIRTIERDPKGASIDLLIEAGPTDG